LNRFEVEFDTPQAFICVQAGYDGIAKRQIVRYAVLASSLAIEGKDNVQPSSERKL
jgi:hypothetical protein